MKKTLIIFLVSATVICLVTRLGSPFRSRQNHHAYSNVYVDTRFAPGLAPSFYIPLKEMNAVSNHLCQPSNRQLLARQSRVDEKDFHLIDIRGGEAKGTLSAHYSGVEKNQVLCLASNASVMMLSFFKTNQPGWEVQFEEPTHHLPPTLMEGISEGARQVLRKIF